MRTDDKVEREKRTVQAMILLYCQENHQPGPSPCEECLELQEYASQRVKRCKFGSEKPTCGKCTVHCYKPDMRQRIIAVMKYAGPKMLLHHPVIAVQHLLDGHRK
ncbi:MAG: nitrous oxide-stimulated promoter family protein [Peptococcaceae bacterium]|nr:nitrous oxide-stimulated promoter family protein [Peptococcaceae bacterium]